MVICWSHLCCVSKGGRYCNDIPAWGYQLHSRVSPVKQLAFKALKKCLVSTRILVRLNFTKLFILDVDWSTKGVGAVLCQKDGRKGVVVPYESKGQSKSQKNYHPMEGECYPLVWVVLHFKQYLHHVDFILRMDQKPV